MMIEMTIARAGRWRILANISQWESLGLSAAMNRESARKWFGGYSARYFRLERLFRVPKTRSPPFALRGLAEPLR